jgi:hypothetical protein
MTYLLAEAQRTRLNFGVEGEWPFGVQVSVAMRDPSLLLSVDQSFAGAPWLLCSARCRASEEFALPREWVCHDVR